MSRDPMLYLRVDPAKAMKEQAAGFDTKKWVWIPVTSTEGYVPAQVKSAAGDIVTLETKDGKVCCDTKLYFISKIAKKKKNCLFL